MSAIRRRLVDTEVLGLAVNLCDGCLIEADVNVCVIGKYPDRILGLSLGNADASVRESLNSGRKR